MKTLIKALLIISVLFAATGCKEMDKLKASFKKKPQKKSEKLYTIDNKGICEVNSFHWTAQYSKTNEPYCVDGYTMVKITKEQLDKYTNKYNNMPTINNADLCTEYKYKYKPKRFLAWEKGKCRDSNYHYVEIWKIEQKKYDYLVEIVKWKKAGVKRDYISDWENKGFNLESATKWSSLGMSCDIATKYKKKGITPKNAKIDIDKKKSAVAVVNKKHDEEMARWEYAGKHGLIMMSGYVKQDAEKAKKRWSEIGISNPKVAKEWIVSGFDTPEKVQEVIKKGYKTPKKAKSYASAKNKKAKAKRIKNTHVMKPGNDYKCEMYSVDVSRNSINIIGGGFAFEKAVLQRSGEYGKYVLYTGHNSEWKKREAKVYTKKGINGKDINFEYIYPLHCEKAK